MSQRGTLSHTRSSRIRNNVMLAVQYSQYSTDPYDLELVEVARPLPKPGQLLIRILYAGMNHVDAIVYSGLMKSSNWRVEFPFTPGYEFSGIVEEVGEGVGIISNKHFHIGDEVFGVNWDQGRPNSKDPHSHEPIASCFAEFICISAEKVSRKPSNVSWEVAAAMGLAGTVAYQCVHDIGYVMSDSRVLVIGGNTLVGNLAIQLAKSRGAFVASVCRSNSHVAPPSPVYGEHHHHGDGFNLTRSFSSSSQSGRVHRANSKRHEELHPILSRSPSSIIETKSNSQDELDENHIASNCDTADLVIHYDREDWYKHPDCRGFDFILDAVGEPSTLTVLKETEEMIHVGAAYVNLVNPAVGLIPQGHPPFSYARFYCFNQNTAHQDLIAQMVADGKLHIPIREVFSFTLDGVAEMFKMMASRRHKGKLILEISNLAMHRK